MDVGARGAPASSADAPRRGPPESGRGPAHTQPAQPRRTLVAAAISLAVGGAIFGAGLDGGLYSSDSRAAFAVALWWALALFVAVGVWPRTRIPAAALVTGGLLAAFCVWTGLSALWAPAAETAFDELSRVTLYLGVFAIVVLATRRGSAPAWADGLALGIVAVAVVALLARCFPDLTTADDELPALLPPTFPQRLTYPLDYWNGLGIFSALAVPFLLRGATTSRRVPWPGVALAPVPVIAAAIYMTSSRGAVAVVAAGAAAFLAFSPRRLLTTAALLVGGASATGAVLVLHARRALVDGPLHTSTAASQGRSAALLLLVLVLATGAVWALVARLAPRWSPAPRPVRLAVWGLVAIAALVAVLVAGPRERVDEFKKPPADSVPGLQTKGYTAAHLTSGGGAGRWQFWGGALREFRAYPVAGHGAGSFESWWAQHGSISYFVRNAHSLWFETLGELGIIGLLLIGGAFLAALAAGLARLRGLGGDERATAAALVAVVLAFILGATIDWAWQLVVIGSVAIVSLALLAGPALAPAAGGTPSPAPWRLPLAARIAAVVVALAVVGYQGAILLGGTRLDDSRAAAARNDTKDALDDALAARRLVPWSSEPALQLALLEERSGDIEAAQRWIGRAVEKNDSDWRLQITKARIDLEAGDAAAARRDLARARTLNPRSPIFANR
jgi:O-antigen ligase